ncbi:MAG TPA: hypothetical protein DDX93_03640 [Smithella sp.]|nr:hypothetical protein [Smithella sp.]
MLVIKTKCQVGKTWIKWQQLRNKYSLKICMSSLICNNNGKKKEKVAGTKEWMNMFNNQTKRPLDIIRNI